MENVIVLVYDKLSIWDLFCSCFYHLLFVLGDLIFLIKRDSVHSLIPVFPTRVTVCLDDPVYASEPTLAQNELFPGPASTLGTHIWVLFCNSSLIRIKRGVTATLCYHKPWVLVYGVFQTHVGKTAVISGPFKTTHREIAHLKKNLVHFYGSSHPSFI